MSVLKIPTKISIQESPGKGLGVFATELIKKDEIIEECHLIEADNLRHHPNLERYLFSYPKKSSPFYHMIALGYGSIYNHSSSPNADWNEHDTLKAFKFFAIKDILPGEEIVIEYNNKEFKNA